MGGTLAQPSSRSSPGHGQPGGLGRPATGQQHTQTTQRFRHHYQQTDPFAQANGSANHPGMGGGYGGMTPMNGTPAHSAGLSSPGHGQPSGMGRTAAGQQSQHTQRFQHHYQQTDPFAQGYPSNPNAMHPGMGGHTLGGYGGGMAPPMGGFENMNTHPMMGGGMMHNGGMNHLPGGMGQMHGGQVGGMGHTGQHR